MSRSHDDGEIELYHDPEKDLPHELVVVLEQAILVPDPEAGAELIKALELFVEAWREFEDTDEAESWADQFGKSDLVVQKSADGTIVLSNQGTPYVTVSRNCVELLADLVLRQDEAERVARIEALADMLGNWMLLLVDDEKLIGHLVKIHGAGSEIGTFDHEDLCNMHSAFHKA